MRVRSLRGWVAVVVVVTGTAAKPGDEPARPDPGNVVDVRQFGARPDGKTDSRAAFQRAVDYVAGRGGGDVLVPGGAAPYVLGGPVSIKGTDVRITGLGHPRVTAMGAYGGPLLTVGLQAKAGEFAAAYRPSGARVYDDSVPPGRKYGFASHGKSALGITSHPLQFGMTPEQKPPDFWQTTDPLTLDILVRRGAKQDWKPVAGLTDELERPAPWCLRFTPYGFGLDLLDRDRADDAYRLAIPCPADPGLYRLSVQVDPASGRAAAWVNRRAVAVRWDTALGAWPAGRPLRRHDGFRPFQIAAQGPIVWHWAEAFTDLTLYGFRLTRAAVYDWDARAQAFRSGPSVRVTDQTQFFANDPSLFPPERLLGVLPLDGPADGSPWLRVDTAGRSCLLAWLPPGRMVNAASIAIENLSLQGTFQPALTLGQHYDLRLVDFEATGMQGVGAMPFGPSYPVYLDRCKFSGIDAGAVFWQHMGEARGLQVPHAGITGVRAFGGDWLFDGVKVWRISPFTDSIFRFVGHSDGGDYTVRKLQVDNEEPQHRIRTAVIDCLAGTWRRGALTIDTALVSRVDPGACFLRLDGLGLDKGNREPYRVDAKGLSAFSSCPVALRVEGKLTWYGDVDLRALPPGKAEGDPELLRRIHITPPVDKLLGETAK